MVDALVSASLRQTEIQRLLVEQYHFERVCLELMKKFPESATIQLKGLLLTRLLVSCCHECEDALVKNGIMDVIKKNEAAGQGLRVAASQLRLAIKSVDLFRV